MTGVSAAGKAILVPAGGCSGDLNPFGSFFDLLGRPCFAFFASGAFGVSSFRDERVLFSVCGAGSAFFDFAAPLVGLRVGSSVVVPCVNTALASSAARFFGGRPLRGVDFGGAFSTSECETSDTGSTEGLDFFDGTRENKNPSESS